MAEEIQQIVAPEPPESKLPNVAAKATKYLPLMKQVKEKAVARLEEQFLVIKNFSVTYDGAPTDECTALLEGMNQTLVGAKKAYDYLNEKRVDITAPLDEIKQQLMEYEKAVATDKKTDNFYTAICREMAAIQNKQIAFKAEIERQAQRRRDVENYKVDLQMQMKKNLTALMLGYVKTTDTGSENFWKLATLENFSAKEDKFKTWTPSLKQEDFDKAFQVVYDPVKLLIDDRSKAISEAKTTEERKKVVEERTAAGEKEFLAVVSALQVEETYEKWHALMIEAITPVINNWRGKISQIKENLLALKNAADEEERKKIADQQAAQAAEDQKQRDAEFKEVEKETHQAIEQEASMQKTQNEFTVQAITQEIPDSGPTKKVYFLVDEKKAAKGIVNAVIKTLGSKEFSAYARDKAKKTKIDPDTNQAQWNEHIDFFLKFVAQNCPMELDGFQLRPVAKIIVRE